jgi:phosphate transport system substrate-binding protein
MHTILGMILAMAAFNTARADGANGSVKVDGSSTVFPLTEAVAEEFQAQNPKVKVTVGVSGTGGGMKKFLAGELDIAAASRPIRSDELEKAQKQGLLFLELPVALDGLSVVVSPQNKFVKVLSKDQLKKIWEPGSKVKNWKDLDETWPNEPVKLYGPGADSGSFEYFTEHVMGKAKSSRNDYTASEDDNTLVNGVSGDKNALGYFGYAYYVANQSKLRAVALDFGAGAVLPSDRTVEDGSYPISRPLFLVVNRKALERPEVDRFVRFYLKGVREYAKSVGYTPLPQGLYDQVQKRFETRKTGPWVIEASH